MNFEKITERHIVNIAILSLTVYILAKTRTALLVQIALLIMLMLYKTRLQSTKFLDWCAMLAVPVMSSLFLVHSYSTGNKLVVLLDKFLSGRIRLGAYAYELYGLTAFGENFKNLIVVWDEVWKLNGHTFDCVYTYLFSNQGFVWLVTIIIAFVYLVKRNNAKINIMLIIWSMYGVSEVHVLDGARFFPILLISLLIGSGENHITLIESIIYENELS